MPTYTRQQTKEFDNTNRGSLFKNDKKEADTHPDYKGQINVNGEEFWLNAWLKTSKQGTKFMSLSISPKDRQVSEPTRKNIPVDDSSDIPF
jgi:uncharacterized protein (DUF736 family)